jgi:hypothetical protein
LTTVSESLTVLEPTPADSFRIKANSMCFILMRTSKK